MRTIPAFVAVLLTATAFGNCQSIQGAAKLCLNSSDYDRIVRACTAAINSGKLSDAELIEVLNKRAYWSVERNPTLAIHDYTQAIRLRPSDPDQFHYRADAYLARDDYARALADFTEAIRLKSAGDVAPGPRVDFHYRGLTYFKSGDCDRAIEDYDSSLSLEPDDLVYFDRANAYCGNGDYASAFRDYDAAIGANAGSAPLQAVYLPNRGICYYAKGDYERASQDFLKTSAVLKNDLVSPIWTYLARVHMGQPNALAQLRSDLAGLRLRAWPGPIAKLYMGETTPEEVMPSTNASRQIGCQAFFYLGEYALLHKRKLQATRWFGKSVASRFSCFEAAAAQAELHRLSGQER